jgi:3-dehydroquinate synthetase/shikimate kinase
VSEVTARPSSAHETRSPPGRDLALAGPAGSGKTSVGRELARLLGRSFEDLDGLTEAREGRSVSQLFEGGESVFRAAERRAAESWLERGGARARVLALGGGTLEDAELAGHITRSATLVTLDAGAEVLALRLGESGRRSRPLVSGCGDTVAALARLRRERSGGYARAVATIDTEALSIRDAAVAVLRALYSPAAGPWLEPPRPLARDLECARGVSLGRGAAKVEPSGRLFVLRDAGLPEVHRSRLGSALGAASTLDLPAGEQAKTADVLGRAWGALLDAGAERSTAIHAEGGGALTDVAGLVAATFKRGLPLHLHPTTLIGQLDAALGGKSAINLRGVKNVVGTVRLPESVQIDPLYLTTLSRRELSGGLAEAVKCALIGDPELLALVESGARDLLDSSLPLLERVVERAARVKLSLVRQDLHENGPRQLLNLGHTLGHALESASLASGRPLGHGEAVSIGLVFSARLARAVGLLEERELPERVERSLAALGLPTVPQEGGAALREVVREALGQDKKRQGGRQTWVLPLAPGRVVRHELDEHVVGRELAELM